MAVPRVQGTSTTGVGIPHPDLGPDPACQTVAEHCEMLNRSLANRRILDWLDATLSNGT